MTSPWKLISTTLIPSGRVLVDTVCWHFAEAQSFKLCDYGMEAKNMGNGYYWMLVIVQAEEIKIIQQYKEVDGHVLIGNVGGYIGLFLGKKLKLVFICYKSFNSFVC